jgi:2-polyprenyl-6-methoxyphenol hydroxylase-like FAD-dependent oxidoreductase
VRPNGEPLSPPPPAVVLRRELEIRQPDRNKGGDDDEDDKHDEQDAVDRVDLVPPHAGEDVVQLDVDGAEGQEPGHDGLRDDVAVPGQGGDLPRELAGVARGRKVGGGVVLAGDAAHDLEVQDAASMGRIYRGRMQTSLQ